MKNIYKSGNSLFFRNDFCNWETGELLSPIETQNYFIVQVTECYYNNSFIIKEHKQYCDLEITFPTTNGLSCSTNGKYEHVNKNEPYLSFRNENHEVASRNGCRFQTIAINFKDGPCFALFEELRTKFKDIRTFSPSDIARTFTVIFAEFLNSAPFFTYNLDCSITALLIKLLRFGNEQPNEKMLPSEEMLPEIINYIDSHFLDICSLEELSRFGYTYNHICKIFKKTYGFSPSDYLLSKKMEYATTLLSQNKTLSEIAELLGYSSPYNFSRAFKKHFGLPPNEFKKRKE